ncbi:HugZ family protein [Francisella sp. SYW-9]|uniref:HugZ family pyridoxamine 5'-phosphate oxidase n=1 Tax=Francisella sp. SYW-9 TaxID=2610888 RepID=UPI00123D8EF2|nr:pyridoxamine 5'-phosphate oxidase family protein [Francisella sp. SYW-9]
MNKKQDAAFRARRVVRQKLYGVLSTQLISMPGYPFGSMVEYAINQQGNIVVYIANLSQHTRNINVDNKVSLTIIGDETTDIRATPRVTIIGSIRKSNLEDNKEIYSLFFPNKAGFSSHKGFNYCEIEIERVRFIGGFGDAHWIKKDDFCLKQNFTGDSISSVVKHINEENLELIKLCYQLHVLNQTYYSELKMIYFDQEGLWLQSEYKNHYINFEKPVETLESLKTAFIEMGKKARAQQS